MFDYIDNHAVIFMQFVAVTLFFQTFLVLAFALYSRWKLKREEVREEKTREKLGELIIRYVSGDLPIKYIRRALKSKLDYVTLLKLVNTLDQTLDGVEEERLQKLMEEKNTRLHFQKRFTSQNRILQAKACLYFSRRKYIHPEKVQELVRLSEVNDPILAYASTSAVIVHGKLKQKQEAIRNVLHNPGVSPMAVSDLLINFTKHGSEYLWEEMSAIAGFIEYEDLTSDRKALLIKIFDELEYFQSVEFLKETYQKVDKESEAPEVVDALIKVLTKFGVEEIIPDIHEYFAVSKNALLRETAASSMGFFLKEESLPVLKWLINDRDFNVRMQAARSLSQYPNVEMDKIKCATVSDKDWKRLVGEIQALKNS